MYTLQMRTIISSRHVTWGVGNNTVRQTRHPPCQYILSYKWWESARILGVGFGRVFALTVLWIVERLAHALGLTSTGV